MKDLEPNLIKLVTQTVKDIADKKGYTAYPKEHDVVMVLTALMVVNEAVRRIENGTRGNRKNINIQKKIL